MATVSASSTAAANGPRPPNAELPTPPNAPRGSRASFATLKRPCSPANPCLSFALLVTFCSAPVVYFYSALDTHLVGDQAFDLLHLCSQRVAVIGISSEALRADEPSTTTAYRDTHLVAKLILLARLALGDALHFRFMHTVDLVLVMLLLCVDSMRCLK